MRGEQGTTGEHGIAGERGMTGERGMAGRATAAGTKRPDAGRPDTGRPDVSRPDTGRLGTGRPDVVRDAGAAAASVLCVRMRRIDGAPLDTAAHHGVLDLLTGLTPVVQALPPEGALADVRGALRYFDCDPVRLAALLRVRALARYGVECAVGAAPNPLLARLAARGAEPGRTLLVPGHPAAVREFLAGKPAAALDGVGPRTARTLAGYGLDTVDRIAAAPLPVLQRILGARAGRELHERAHGIDRTPVLPGAPDRSLAAERPFGHDETDPDRHRRALLSLTEELGARLRSREQVCRSLTLTVRCADRTTVTRTRTLAEPTAHSVALTATARTVYESLGLQRARVRVLGLRAEGIGPAARAARQLSLDPEDDRARRIEAVTDLVRAKFGPGAVLRGTLAA